MDKTNIAKALREHHDSFLVFLSTLEEKEFTLNVNEKWSPGQQLDHICRSVKPVRLAFLMPGFLLRWLFGKSNRPGRSYDELVNRYKERLAKGGRAGGRFVPGAIAYKEKDKLSRQLKREVEALIRNMDRYSEKALDQYLLPHPLMGKLTLREMLYFTMYHVQHHEIQTRQNIHEV